MKVKNIYLLAHYSAHPRDPSQTKVKGYMTNPNNIRYDEKVEFSLGLPSKKLVEAKVILDLNEKKVVRNGWSGDKTFDDLFLHFHKGYDKYLNAVMSQIDAAYLEKMTGVKLNNGNETTETDTSEPVQPVSDETQEAS